MDFSRKKIKNIILAHKPQHYKQSVLKTSVTKNILNYNKLPQQNPKEPPKPLSNLKDPPNPNKPSQQNTKTPKEPLQTLNTPYVSHPQAHKDPSPKKPLTNSIQLINLRTRDSLG